MRSIAWVRVGDRWAKGWRKSRRADGVRLSGVCWWPEAVGSEWRWGKWWSVSVTRAWLISRRRRNFSMCLVMFAIVLKSEQSWQ